MKKNPESTHSFQIKFIDKQNLSQYKQTVLHWLKTDFYQQTKEQGKPPEKHFWYNGETISNAFDNHHAMVVVNEKNELIGYMIWSRSVSRAEIDIVEIKEAYRRLGIFRQMLSAMETNFPDLIVLSAMPIPQSVKVFSNLGWTSIAGSNDVQRFYKTLKPHLTPHKVLPNGAVIAIFSKADLVNSHEHVDFYTVKKNPSKFGLQYFQITLNRNGTLQQPIISPFHYEGYVGIFLDGKLVTEGKAKHLFENTVAHNDLNLLIMDRLVPLKPELFTEFFSSAKELQEAASATTKHAQVNATQTVPPTTMGTLLSSTSAAMFSSSAAALSSNQPYSLTANAVSPVISSAIATSSSTRRKLDASQQDELKRSKQKTSNTEQPLNQAYQELTLEYNSVILAVCQFVPQNTLPSWVSFSPNQFVSITQTPDELTIVCSQTMVPDGVKVQKDWRMLRIKGQLDFAQVGVLERVIKPLAENQISIYAMSTFNTDYVLVQVHQFDRALEVLKQHFKVECLDPRPPIPRF